MLSLEEAQRSKKSHSGMLVLGKEIPEKLPGGDALEKGEHLNG